jgi:hypothetical protein
MIRKFSAVLAALAFAAVTIAPTAEAQHRRDGYNSGRHYRDHDRRWRHHDNDGDEAAAAVLGLVLGLAIGSLASQPREPEYRCSDNYRRCSGPPPPPRCADRCGYERDSEYDPRYDDRGGAYEREYGLEGGPEGSYDPYYEPSREQCTRRERQWDRYAGRYLIVDVPVPC